MSFMLKVLITLLVSGLIAVVVLVRIGDRGSADVRAWRGGESDPVRRLLLNSDGTLRASARIGVVAVCCVFIAVLWVLVPSR
jgi:hypothetical protein